jgi:hypothetical protein
VNPSGFSYTPSQLVCNGDTGVRGIGRDAAQRIYYRALTVYFTSTETYPQARADYAEGGGRPVRRGSTQYNAGRACVERRVGQLIVDGCEMETARIAGRFLFAICVHHAGCKRSWRIDGARR